MNKTCAECGRELDEKHFYVVGAHLYVCSNECYQIVLTATFGVLTPGNIPSQR